jgi:hypothetical protein
MVDSVFRHQRLSFIVVVSAGVQIPIEPREIAARDLETNT